jgi:hypothetical protein
MTQQQETQRQLFYTLDEVKREVFSGHISKSTLLNMVKAGQLPTVTMMRRKYIPAWWVEEQIKKATIKPEIKDMGGIR